VGLRHLGVLGVGAVVEERCRFVEVLRGAAVEARGGASPVFTDPRVDLPGSILRPPPHQRVNGCPFLGDLPTGLLRFFLDFVELVEPRIMSARVEAVSGRCVVARCLLAEVLVAVLVSHELLGGEVEAFPGRDRAARARSGSGSGGGDDDAERS
jgi:hypothetical protein